MKTLQEMAILTVLKFGIRYKEIVLTLIQNKIDAVERTILHSLTGSEYYEYYRVIDCLEFDISWRHGTWTLFREICSRTTITTREPSAYRQAKKHSCPGCVEVWLDTLNSNIYLPCISISTSVKCTYNHE